LSSRINLIFFEKVDDILIHQAGYFGIAKHIAVKNAEKQLKQLGYGTKDIPKQTPFQAE